MAVHVCARQQQRVHGDCQHTLPQHTTVLVCGCVLWGLSSTRLHAAAACGAQCCQSVTVTAPQSSQALWNRFVSSGCRCRERAPSFESPTFAWSWGCAPVCSGADAPVQGCAATGPLREVAAGCTCYRSRGPVGRLICSAQMSQASQALRPCEPQASWEEMLHSCSQ